MAIEAVKALVTYRMGSRNAANVLWFRIDDVDYTTQQQLADDFTTEWNLNMHQDATAASCIFTGVRLTDANSTWTVESTANLPGSATGEMAGPAAAFLLRYTLVGTTRKGRSYLPGVPEQAMDSLGVVAGTTLTYLNAQANLFWTDMATLYPSISHVVRSDGVIPVYREVLSRQVDGLIATQRRRLRG